MRWTKSIVFLSFLVAEAAFLLFAVVLRVLVSAGFEGWPYWSPSQAQTWLYSALWAGFGTYVALVLLAATKRAVNPRSDQTFVVKAWKFLVGLLTGPFHFAETLLDDPTE